MVILNFFPHPKAYHVTLYCLEQRWVDCGKDLLFASSITLLLSDLFLSDGYCS